MTIYTYLDNEFMSPYRVDPAGVRSRNMNEEPIMLRDPITFGTWMAITSQLDRSLPSMVL